MNKNAVRESLRRALNMQSFVQTGVERVVDQVIQPKKPTVFRPKIKEITYEFLEIDDNPLPPPPQPTFMQHGAYAPTPPNGPPPHYGHEATTAPPPTVPPPATASSDLAPPPPLAIPPPPPGHPGYGAYFSTYGMPPSWGGYSVGMPGMPPSWMSGMPGVPPPMPGAPPASWGLWGAPGWAPPAGPPPPEAQQPPPEPAPLPPGCSDDDVQRKKEPELTTTTPITPTKTTPAGEEYHVSVRRENSDVAVSMAQAASFPENVQDIATPPRSSSRTYSESRRSENENTAVTWSDRK